MNILELKKELQRQINSLQKELNSVLSKYRLVPIIVGNDALNIVFSIEKIEEDLEVIGYIKNLELKINENKKVDKNCLKECLEILNKYSNL